MSQENKSYDLVVLAAGMGSRFGGLKQAEPVGPQGEWLIEYSIYDAWRAGFGQVVFVIRPEMEKDFRERIGRRIEPILPVAYAFQELSNLPDGFSVPEGRSKPWGTGHAVLAAADAIRSDFAVINADDYYGPGAYRVLAEHFQTTPPKSLTYALVAYRLDQTLSEHGAVSRGVCYSDSAGNLREIREMTDVVRGGDGGVSAGGPEGRVPLTGSEPVSMNFWGFGPSLLGPLAEAFRRFLAGPGGLSTGEFYLPTAVSSLIAEKGARVRLLQSGERWFGLTYREDLQHVRRQIRERIEGGVYPSKLWEEASEAPKS